MKQNWKKNVTIFMSSQALSLFGSSLVQYAITWHITLTMKSGLYEMIAIVCGFVPTFLLSPVGGVWADRYNRKVLIMVADGCIALCTLVLALIFMTGYQEVWLLFVALSVRGFGAAVQMPCVGAMLPDVVPEGELTRINGINSSLQSFLFLVSPMLAGALLGLMPLSYIFFIDVITASFAIGILLLFFHIPYTPKLADEYGNDYFRELKQGFRYIQEHRYLRNFFIFCGIFFIMAGPVAFLTPLQTARIFGADVWRLTAIEVTFSVGMMIGGLVIAAWGGMKNRVHTMVLSGVLMGVLTIALGFPKYFVLYLGFMTLFGLVMPIFNTPTMVLLQEQVDSEYLGRVFGVMTMISSSMMPLGMIVFGPLADMVPIEWLLIGTGIMILATSFALLWNKPLIEAGAKHLEKAAE